MFEVLMVKENLWNSYHILEHSVRSLGCFISILRIALRLKHSLLFLVHRRGTWNSEQLSNLPKVTLIVCGSQESHPDICLCESRHALPMRAQCVAQFE